MPIGTIIAIPNFQFYGGVQPSSVEDSQGAIFYCGYGWYGGKKTEPGTYLFRIGVMGKISNIPLSPQPTSQGTMTVDTKGLMLACTTGDKVVRFRIPEYIPGPPGSPVSVVVTGDAADAQARNAIARLQSADRADDARDAAQEASIGKLMQRVSAEEAQNEVNLQTVKDFLWNDKFITDLLYDIIHNRKDKGIRDSLAEMIRAEMKKP